VGQTVTSVIPNIRLKNVSITFGDNRALDAVNLEIPGRQVVGLVGENGSGKSTLIKILNGVYRPDPVSRIFVRGEEIFPYEDTSAFRRLGISFVHQDLGLIPTVSITENLLHERILHSKGAFINWKRMHGEAREILEKFGITADPRQLISSLTDTDKALVAILRAVEELGQRKTLLVLDEPTVFLPRTGTDLLFGVIRRLLDEYEMSVLLVSHDLEEVIANSDTIAVLQGGKLQATLPSSSVTTTYLGELMVGRSVNVGRPARTPGSNTVALTCRELAAGRASSVSFELRRGEILGLTGLAGSGFEDVLPAIYGVRPLPSGSVTTADGTTGGSSPLAALSKGIVYVPADRKTEGGMLDVSLQENAVMPRLASVAGALGVSQGKLSSYGRQFVEKYDVRPANPRKNFRLLSGGNQQKVVLGKWLDTDPAVILLQDPTQGVDVGAREAINDRLLEAAENGASVICATTDYEQLALICDRVLIIDSGTVVDELAGPDIDRYEIALRVMQGSHDPTIRKVG
jgi:ribose transport system ATP-binding protein